MLDPAAYGTHSIPAHGYQAVFDLSADQKSAALLQLLLGRYTKLSRARFATLASR